MNEFTAKFGSAITGGIERFRPLGVSGNAAADFVSVWDVGYLWAKQVPLTEFGKHVNEIILRVKEAALR